RAALHKKLLRDLVRLRGQVVTIALVLGCGIASFVALRGVFWSLEQARLRFYQRQRFADVFATLERAPERLHRVLQTIPGVERIQIRVVEKAMLPLADAPEPIAARVVSLPEAESLNAIQLREGRRPSAAHQDEVVLLAGFADAHHVKPGDQLPAIINGKLRKLRVVGTAASPEYIMAVSPGSFNPDPNRLAVIWMTAEAVLASFGMRGEFNDVALELVPGASEPGAIDAVDRVLAPYGGLGAYGRSRQPSHRMLSDKLIQLQSLSTVLPLIFLAVAALLVNVVLTRLIQLERSEIATLKAIGYSNARVGLHYLELVLAVGAPGVPLGVALGAYFGAQMVKLYTFYFRIPDLAFRLDGRDVLLAASVSVLSAMAGALSGVYRAVTLPPAEAMRPPSPARYRRGFSDWLGASALGPSAQMVVRELERRPLRAVLSVLAIAASTALSVVGGWYYDGIYSLLDTQFHRAMREDILIAFTKPRPERAVRELAHLSGVRHAEGLRLVPVRLRSAHHYRDVVLWGYPDQSEMRQLRNSLGASVPLPADGLVLTDLLARILDVGVKDSIEVDFLEGSRGKRNLVVSGLVSEAF
ncbi:MAG TPA: ABC transporter permease, partial [Polyangiaceae bacterium]